MKIFQNFKNRTVKGLNLSNLTVFLILIPVSVITILALLSTSRWLETGYSALTVTRSLGSSAWREWIRKAGVTISILTTRNNTITSNVIKSTEWVTSLASEMRIRLELAGVQFVRPAIFKYELYSVNWLYYILQNYNFRNVAVSPG